MAAVARVFRGCRFLMSPAGAAAAGGKKPVAAAAGAQVTKADATAAQVTKADATAAKVNRGIMKPLPVSDALRKFAGGAPEVSRPGAVKLIWAHIKAQGLQNPANKKEINCDEKLKSLFGGRDKIGMMEISKLLSPHFVKN
ncbi:upstream activation factor subunit UAF30-like [Phragmites australis]|uniref:upstream activation factor subunit UAF30-like n=1 Tax=Phragmites australis TaxID=29695 RepID=UPI002D7A3F24|nr:upstream activation factor subunit UAF30-like [Phragmites australis]